MRDTPTAIILCGGAGLRLRSVIGNSPKAMASVAGRPFLEVLFHQLRRHGFARAVLAVGFQKDVIESHFGERAFGLDVVYSVEASPLGTGGALRNAADLVESESVLVMNGDSYTDVDLCGFLAAHREARADASVVLVPADGRKDCGLVRVAGNGQLASFDEKKEAHHEAYVNAGIYFLSRQLLYEIPSGTQVSLEREVLPGWLHHGKDIRGFISQGKCTDIGTPERYEDAQQILANVETAASEAECGSHL